MTAFVAKAEALARFAHHGQTDKIGQPYIEHPARVAVYTRLTGRRLNYWERKVAEAAAWLHDVIEDTHITVEILREEEYPEEMVAVVVLLTRTKGQSPEEYYRLIAENPIALAVKHADLIDNTDPHRVASLRPEDQRRLGLKYRKAAQCLGVNPQQWWSLMRTSEVPSSVG